MAECKPLGKDTMETTHSDGSKVLFHRQSGTYVIQRGVFKGNVRVDKNLITGMNVHFYNDLVVEGDVLLGGGSYVGGYLFAVNALLGTLVKVKGDIQLSGNLRVMDGCSLHGHVVCKGDVRIRPGVYIEDLMAEGEVIVEGKSHIKELEAKSLIEVPEGMMS